MQKQKTMGKDTQVLLTAVAAMVAIVGLIIFFTGGQPLVADDGGNIAGQGAALSRAGTSASRSDAVTTAFGRLVAVSEPKPPQYVARDAVRDAIIKAAVESSSLKDREIVIVQFSPASDDDWDFDGGFSTADTVELAIVDSKLNLNIFAEDTLTLKNAIKNLPKLYPDVKVGAAQPGSADSVVVRYGTTKVIFDFRLS